MSTAVAMVESKPKRTARRISKEQFLQIYSNREDRYKYEWNDGIVEKTAGMSQRHSKFFILLLRTFLNTTAYRKEGEGMLLMMTDMDTSPVQLRRPDIAFYTAEQLPKMWGGENQVAPWVAEVISPTDKVDDVNSKLEEYFRAGVRVVWHIFPHSMKVDVYTSPESVTICRGKTLCNGAPVLPDFQMVAEELFA